MLNSADTAVLCSALYALSSDDMLNGADTTVLCSALYALSSDTGGAVLC
jgi:hypothetical protein